jgi:hypothetical protein
MLTVCIPGPRRSEAVVSVTEIRIDGVVMHSDGAEVARYFSGAWDFGAFDAIVIPIPCDAKIRFSGGGQSVDCGPFESLRIVDGAIRGGKGTSHLLATLDATSAKWRLKDGTEWDCVTIRRPHRFI